MYACDVPDTHAWTRHSRVRGPKVYVEHASAGLGRARVRIEKQRAPDGLGTLLTNILRVVADYRGGDALRVVRVEQLGADARAAVLGAVDGALSRGAAEHGTGEMPPVFSMIQGTTVSRFWSASA